MSIIPQAPLQKATTDKPINRVKSDCLRGFNFFILFNIIKLFIFRSL